MPSRRASCATLLAVCSLLLLTAAPAAQPTAGRNLILITLDGARWQEIFGGLDIDALRADLKKKKERAEDARAYKQYWAPTPEARRAKLMPFFWTEWMSAHGSIAGNRAAGSRFGVTNTHRFSFPGYAEILTGEAHAVIDSNDGRRYSFPTVLDVLQRRLSLSHEQVAAFGSWATFRWITSNQEDAFVTNAGYQAFASERPEIQRLSQAQFETQTPWDSVRNDMYTFRLALAHLETARPRVLYLALGETDDWAHDSRYDRVLQTLELTDRWFKELWTWLQADPQYRDNTAILITVDHGRGRKPKEWSWHGKKVKGAEETWLAAIGPDWPRRGEWTNAPDAFTNQIAATGAKALGVDLRADIPNAGAPIEYLWRR